MHMMPSAAIQNEFDVYSVRKHFPILDREVKNKPLVYFDNAATTQKPKVVIDALVEYYSRFNANIHRGIHSLAEEATAAFEATRDTAKRASENLLNRFGDQVQGIFTPNESSTAGMLLALQDIGKAGKVFFVGFDSSQPFIDAMKTNQLNGIVVQNPFNMGYLGVRTMVANLQGTAVEQKIDTGVMLVTKDNMAAPEVQALLHPPLDQFLK